MPKLPRQLHLVNYFRDGDVELDFLWGSVSAEIFERFT